MKKTVAVYARVSTKDHSQNPETQLIMLRDWADRQGMIISEYVDQASGKDLNRPAWKRLAEDWRAGKIDVIAVVRLDRAFRSVRDMHACLSEWEGRGIRFASITQPVDTGTPVGKLLTTMLGAVAEFERDLKPKEFMKDSPGRGKKEKHSAGRKLGCHQLELPKPLLGMEAGGI